MKKGAALLLRGILQNKGFNFKKNEYFLFFSNNITFFSKTYRVSKPLQIKRFVHASGTITVQIFCRYKGHQKVGKK